MKPVVELSNWKFVQTGLRSIRVHGIAKNHPVHGEKGITSSAVVRFGDGVAETQNTIYKLAPDANLN